MAYIENATYFFFIFVRILLFTMNSLCQNSHHRSVTEASFVQTSGKLAAFYITIRIVCVVSALRYGVDEHVHFPGCAGSKTPWKDEQKEDKQVRFRLIRIALRCRMCRS